MNMREAFEEYAEGYCYYLDKDSEGKYKNPATALAWQIWKAAKKSPPLDFSGSQIGNREAEEVIRTMWANGMESEAQALADCFYGLVDANAALAAQVQQPTFKPRDLTKPAEQQGMFNKFYVERVDGSSAEGGKHHGCRYWVLDLDHDKHAPAAMRGYAEDCKETHPVLSAEIFAEFGMQSQAQQESQWMPVETAPTGREFLLAFYYRHRPHDVLRRVVTFVDKDVIALGWCEIPPAPEGDKE